MKVVVIHKSVLDTAAAKLSDLWAIVGVLEASALHHVHPERPMLAPRQDHLGHSTDLH